jgi:hypothetical protein
MQYIHLFSLKNEYATVLTNPYALKHVANANLSYQLEVPLRDV